MALNTAVTAGGTKGGVILTGALRDVYSREIIFNAQPVYRFAQLADTRTELGKEPGDTIKFLRYGDLRGSAKLSEVENIVPVTLSANLQAIEVGEYGYAVQESERLIRTSWDDVMGRAALLLGQHYGFTVEGIVRDQYRAAGSLHNFIVGAGANRAALAAGNTLDVQSVKDAAEYLAVAKAVKIGDAYVGVVHPHQSRGLRDDPNWIDVHKYTSPAVQNIFAGEIGMIEGVRFVETTMAPIIKKTSGAVYEDGYDSGQVEAVANASIDTYQAIITGANAVGWAVALPVEFRDNGVIDFERTRALAWYSIMGAGQIRSENVAMIESA